MINSYSFFLVQVLERRNGSFIAPQAHSESKFLTHHTFAKFPEPLRIKRIPSPWTDFVPACNLRVYQVFTVVLGCTQSDIFHECRSTEENQTYHQGHQRMLRPYVLLPPDHGS